MAGPQHALTLRSKGQRSDPNPNPRVTVLTSAMAMGRDAERCERACRLRLHISFINVVFEVQNIEDIEWYTNDSKTEKLKLNE